MQKLTAWSVPFQNIRTRLVIWYFLIAASTMIFGLWVTRQIYRDRLDEKAEASLVEEVERFERIATQLSIRQPLETEISDLFDQFLTKYVPAQNEMVVTFIDGQLYRASQPLPDWLQHNSTLMKHLANLNTPQRQQIANADQRLFYVAEPLTTDQNVRGTFVALRDSTQAYQSGTEVLRLVLVASIAVLGGFSMITWITAGRVLNPLQLMNQTARNITESDMTQRISIEGNDEIIAVATTFNAMLDRLQLAFNSQQEFLKNVSHELRTPITVIQGQLEILHHRPTKQPETIELIISELGRMNRLVNDLLLLAKAERPDFLYFKPEELDWLTEELFLKARSFSNERDWQLEAKGLYPVLIDKQRFSQAVMNLVQNAVRHTQPGETIALGSIVTDGYLRFWIRDTGEGIALENRGRIFERFTRATNNNHQFAGTRLGLSIVNAIVQAHGGRIELESELGQGTTFTIIIPLSSPQDAQESAPRSRGQSAHRGLSEHRIQGPQL